MASWFGANEESAIDAAADTTNEGGFYPFLFL